MGVFSGALVETRNVGDVGNPLIPPRADGRRTAGVNVTPDSALTLSAVWACMRLRGDLLSTTPLIPYRENGADVPTRLQTLPPVLCAPGGAEMSLEDWLFAGSVALDTRGNNFGIITARDNNTNANGLGNPLRVELVPPDQCSVTRYKGDLVYKMSGKVIDRADVFHERAFVMPGEPLGLSPIMYAARMVGMALAAEQFGADWFADGAHPSSILTTDEPVDESQAKTIKERVLSSLRGNRDPIVLGAGVKWQQVQVAANESQFLEAMKWGVQQVARLYGINPILIGGEPAGSQTYQNTEQVGLDLLSFGLGGAFVRRERALSRLLPQRQFVRYDLKALQRADAETRYKTHAIGVAAKFRTPDEIRAEEGLAPLTAEDKAILELVPMTVTPMGTPKAIPNPGHPQEDLTK